MHLGWDEIEKRWWHQKVKKQTNVIFHFPNLKLSPNFKWMQLIARPKLLQNSGSRFWGKAGRGSKIRCSLDHKYSVYQSKLFGCDRWYKDWKKFCLRLDHVGILKICKIMSEAILSNLISSVFYRLKSNLSEPSLYCKLQEHF